MTDWRSKPRTGKSQVIPWGQVIRERLALGATMKQVFDELVEKDSITLGYRQFVRYVNELTASASQDSSVPNTAKQSQQQANPAQHHSKAPSHNVQTKSVATPEPAKQSTEPNAVPKRPMTPADFRKIREDFDKMDLNALVSGRGIIFDK